MEKVYRDISLEDFFNEYPLQYLAPSRGKAVIWPDDMGDEGTIFGFTGLNLSEYNLSDYNLRGAVFIGCNLCEAYLGGSDLENAIFIDCDLRESRFKECNLESARFINCNLEDVDWSEADCKDASCQKMRSARFVAPGEPIRL